MKNIATNLSLQVLSLRDDYIPEYAADIGIVGENIFYEKEKSAKIVEKFGFAECRYSIAIPNHLEYKSPVDLFYHLFALLSTKNLLFDDVFEVLEKGIRNAMT